MSQRTAKPTVKLVQPVMNQISFFPDHMCLLQPSGYSKRDKQKSLPYWVDLHAELSLCWSHRSYCRFYLALAHIILFTALDKKLIFIFFFFFFLLFIQIIIGIFLFYFLCKHMLWLAWWVIIMGQWCSFNRCPAE